MFKKKPGTPSFCMSLWFCLVLALFGKANDNFKTNRSVWYRVFLNFENQNNTWLLAIDFIFCAGYYLI